MSVEEIRVSPAWLRLREPADAAARATGLIQHLQGAGPWVIHDLACGSGSMGRWLAPQLSGAQHWVLHDRDRDLLEVAAGSPPRSAAVTIETRCSDITRLGTNDLAGATLITASALLDLFTADELDGLVAVCSEAGCPVLFTLSVVGRVKLDPAHSIDARIEAAFNDHQRRGGLLGPDAATFAIDGFRQRGARVIVQPSPWRLGPADAALIGEWFEGWIGAACELDPALEAARVKPLSATVEHADFLVLP